MNKVHYEIIYRSTLNAPFLEVSSDGVWSSWNALGTYSTVVAAIYAAIEQYEYVFVNEVELFFQRNDIKLKAEAGDIFWIKPVGNSRIDSFMKVVETDAPKIRIISNHPPTTYTHPKLRYQVADWNVVKL